MDWTIAAGVILIATLTGWLIYSYRSGRRKLTTAEEEHQRQLKYLQRISKQRQRAYFDENTKTYVHTPDLEDGGTASYLEGYPQEFRGCPVIKHYSREEIYEEPKDAGEDEEAV